MKRLRTAPRKEERGIALLMVLWVLIPLGLIAAFFLRDTSVNTDLARNTAENAKAQALADGGVRRAILGLLDPDPRGAWRADGAAYHFAQGEGLAVIRIQDEGGRVDLNHAPAPLLLELFKVVGVDAEAAEKLVDAIYDFRDADNDRRVGGAEDADYQAAGLDSGAKDAPFDQKEELMQVLGMTWQVYDAIAPYVTVHSRRAEINLATAPEAVLRAIPDPTPEQLDRIRERRAGIAPLGPYQADVVTVRAQASTNDGGFFIREAVIKFSGDAFSPFLILEWRHAWQSTLGPAETAGDRDKP